MVAATVDGLRVVSLYAPERPGRRLAVLRRQAGLVRAAGALGARDAGAGAAALVLGGDLNVAPTDVDVWDAAAVHGGTHVSEPERAAFRALVDLGLTDALPGAPRRSRPVLVVGLPRRASSTRTSGCGSTTCSSRRRSPARIVDAEIDREARKGPPVPSDHAPLLVDLDEPGRPFDPDWEGALARISARTKPRR